MIPAQPVLDKTLTQILSSNANKSIHPPGSFCQRVIIVNDSLESLVSTNSAATLMSGWNGWGIEEDEKMRSIERYAGLGAGPGRSRCVLFTGIN
jgi:hypothetical protein